MTMTRDPDLDAAIDALRFDALRLRQLQRQVAQADDVKEYRHLAARQHEIGELTEGFNAKGEQLNIDGDRRRAGRALLMMTEEAGRWRDRYRRRPSFEQLHAAMQTAARLCEGLQHEAATEAKFAEFARKVATHNAAAALSAVAYMEASR